MTGNLRAKIASAILSGIIMGFAFPPFPAGVFVLFAFLPIFVLFETVESYGEVFRYTYLMFFVVNTITLYWAGGFTHGRDGYLMTAGALLLVAHPLFFTLPMIGWMFVRRQLGMTFSLIAFPFLWTAFEYLHSLSEFAFPWLALGNTQTYDLPVIQFASFTGVYGISFWICTLNVLIYCLYRKVALGRWKPFSVQSILATVGIFVIYLLPKIYGNEVLANTPGESASGVRIGIVQPNIDPFEKWEEASDPQINTLQQLTSQLIQSKPHLVLWPETAVPSYILHPNLALSFGRIKHQIDTGGCSLLAGIPDIVYYPDSGATPPASKISPSGRRFETFNSSMLLQPGSRDIQKYAKMILAPFAEHVPYSEALNFLDAAKWNFGMGGWNIGGTATIFSMQLHGRSDVKFSTMICYESVFPGFVAGFVRNGAQFLTVITNDSWWGNTSGAYQHKQIGVLRAVENRRWVAQCTNGGISCFIDPLGRTVRESLMFERTTMIGEIAPRSDLTFYTRNGDWFAMLCLIVSMGSLLISFGRIVLMPRERKSL